jgi:Polyketide cyclase / dehydrase and lipid transport
MERSKTNANIIEAAPCPNIGAWVRRTASHTRHSRPDTDQVGFKKRGALIPKLPLKFWPLRRMRSSLYLLGLFLCTIATPLHAAIPPTQSITHSIELNLKPDLAWGIVKNFSGLHRWHPGFTDTELTRGADGKAGAFRVAAMKDGPRISDELLQYSEVARRYRYRMVASSLPVDDYIGTISVQGNRKTSIVTWKVNFKRKTSSAAFTDADVKLMIDHLVQVGLTNLKRIASNAA